MPGNQGPGEQRPSVEAPDFDQEATEFRDRVNELVKGDKRTPREAVDLLKDIDNAKVVKANSMAAAEERGPTAVQPAEQRQQDRQAAEGRLPANSANTSFGYERPDLPSQMEAAHRHMQARQTATIDEGRKPSPEAVKVQPETVKDEGRKTSPEAERGQEDQSKATDGAPREMTDRAQLRKSRNYQELIREHQNQEHATKTGRGADPSRS